MKQDKVILRRLALALVLAWVGPGCTRFRKPADPDPIPPVAENVEKTSNCAERKGVWAGVIPPEEHRLKLNPSKVLTMQMQALNAQGKEDEAAIHPKNGFTRWMDEFHQRWYCRLDNAARRLDTKWLAEDIPYDYELSTFDLDILTRVGGRGSDGNFDFTVRFNADLALAGLENKLRLFVDNAGRDTLPSKDPLEKKDAPRVGVRTLWQTVQDSELELGGGVEWSSGPVVFADLGWRWKRKLMDGEFRLRPRGFWYNDDGFGQKTTMTWTRKIGERKIFQILTAEKSTEVSDGVEFEQTFRFAWLRSGRGRGWLAQASVFPHLVSSEMVWTDALVNISWRDALYRKWIYYIVTPQVDFSNEDDYQAKPSLRFGLQILMGGRIGELL